MAHVASIRLRGFKSVGGEWLEVGLKRGLNAVVGPNGCGKSSLLEALCFAFAVPPRALGAASLSDLANSDCNQVCEVCVRLQSGSKAHTVAAVLTPDGSRAYKVDGRARSGSEVRDFLRGLGLALDSSAAVVRQARVTALADSASPAELAALVAQASGLGRRNEEVAAASEELRRTRKAVVDVQASLAALEDEAAGGAESLKALARLHRQDEEAASLAQQVAGMLQAAVGLCQSQAAQGAAARQRAVIGVEAASQRESELRGEFEAARQRLDAALEGQQAAISGSIEQLALQQAVEVAAEELGLLTEQQQRRRALEEAAAATAADARQQSVARGRLAAELAACQQAQQAVAADLEQASSAAAVAALLVSQTAEERQLRAALSAAELAVSAAAAAAAATRVELAELQAEQQQAEAAAQRKSGAAQAAVGCALQAGAQAILQQELHQQRERLVAAQRQEQAAQLEAGTLAARLRAAVGCSGRGTAASGGTCRPLFQCFGVADPLGCQQYAEALQVLAGSKLGVVVADSTEAAAGLMAAGGGIRIWPLDGLAAPDHTQQQRRAAQHFPDGQVVLPLDLLCFEEAHRPALLRAFGAHVIAASDAVAEQLVTRFGVPSVTPEGRVTSRGTLQGGWRGGSQACRQSPMHLKLALEAAEQRLAATQQAVAAAETELSSTQQQLLAAQQEQEDFEAAAAEVAAAASEVRTCQVLLGEQQAAATAAIATAARLQTELAAKQQLARGMAAAGAEGGSGGGSCAGAQAALRSEQQRLATAAAALAQRLAAAAEACAAAEECAAAADDALALCLLEAPSQSEAVGLLERRRAELAACATALEAWQSQHAEQAGQLTALQDEVHRRSGELAAAQQAAEAAAAASAAQAAAAEQLAGQQQQLEQQLAPLILQVPELQAVLSEGSSAGSGKQHAPCLGASGGGGCDKETQAAVRHLRQACAELEQRRGRLLAERRRCSAANLPLSEQQRHREQAQRLAAYRSQLETLQQAAARLQEGIHASNVQVLAVNEAVFRRIAATFQSLTAAALPSLRLRLCKVGKEVHEGVRLQFAHHSKEAAGGGGHTSGDGGSGDGVWRTGLDALSGGQRTLVSLALIVAAAPAGATSSLLLMDEVDGQLDESNQALVARLFQALAGDDTAAGTAAPACRQVLCVSHNAAFQQLCQHMVHLTRGSGGTRLAMKGGDGSSAGGTATRGKKRRGM